MSNGLVVLISGLSGSGKSTIADLVGKKYGLKVVHASGIYHQLIADKNVEAEKAEKNQGFWESEEGKKVFERRMKDSSLDKAVDEKLLEIVEEGNCVIDSWTMPWLSNKGIKIWLKVSDPVRIERIAGRDERDKEGLLKVLKEKENATKEIYKKLYGFDFADNLSVFDAIIDTDEMNIEEVVEKVCNIIEFEKA